MPSTLRHLLKAQCRAADNRFSRGRRVTPLALNLSSFQLPNKPESLIGASRALQNPAHHRKPQGRISFWSNQLGKLNISDYVKVRAVCSLPESVCLRHGYMCMKRESYKYRYNYRYKGVTINLNVSSIIYFSIYPSMYPSTHPPIHPSIHLSVHPSIYCLSPLSLRYFYFYLFIYFLIFYLFIYLFIYIYFWLCWVFVSVRGLSPFAASGGHSSSRCAGLSLSRPLLLWSTGSRCAGSVVVADGPSCSVACGIFPDQGSNPNPCPLH